MSRWKVWNYVENCLWIELLLAVQTFTTMWKQSLSSLFVLITIKKKYNANNRAKFFVRFIKMFILWKKNDRYVWMNLILNILTNFFLSFWLHWTGKVLILFSLFFLFFYLFFFTTRAIMQSIVSLNIILKNLFDFSVQLRSRIQAVSQGARVIIRGVIIVL